MLVSLNPSSYFISSKYFPTQDRIIGQGSKYQISGSYSMEVFISDIGGDIGDTRTHRTFILDTIYNEILITKSWFSVIDIIYHIKMM